MKFYHLCTAVCQKTRKASTSDASDAQQRTCITIRSITDLLMINGLICLDFADVSSVMRGGCSGRMMDFSRISAKLTPLLGQVVGERSLGRLPG